MRYSNKLDVQKVNRTKLLLHFSETILLNPTSKKNWKDDVIILAFAVLIHRKINVMRNENSPRHTEDGAIYNKSIEERQHQSTPYLTMRGAAAFLYVSISTIEKMSANRVVPVYRPSKGKVYFKVQDLIDYIESGRQKSIYELQGEAIQGLVYHPRSNQHSYKAGARNSSAINNVENGRDN